MNEPVLTYPESAVVGATDLPAMALFLGALGMLPRPIREVDSDVARALYGLDAGTRELEMYTPGSDRRVRIVETPNAAIPFAPLVAAPYGLDFFSRDLDVTIGMVTAAGGHNFTELVGYGLEPSMHPDASGKSLNYEILFQGPDELTVYVTDVNKTDERYPTLLDDDPALVNSELVMLCWVTETPDREREFWEQEVGVDVVFDGYASNDGMVDLMYHPHPTLLRCINITDTERNTKIELMSYPDEEVEVQPVWPLRGGLFAGQFAVDDLSAAMAALPSATFGDVVEFSEGQTKLRAVTALSPSRVRFELRETVR
ncbi:hypothetical protein [Microbacterium tumbae]